MQILQRKHNFLEVVSAVFSISIPPWGSFLYFYNVKVMQIIDIRDVVNDLTPGLECMTGILVQSPVNTILFFCKNEFSFSHDLQIHLSNQLLYPVTKSSSRDRTEAKGKECFRGNACSRRICENKKKLFITYVFVLGPESW